MYSNIESIITAKDLAAILKVHYSTVTLWTRQKKLPSYRIGKCIRFRMRDIESFLDKRKTEGAAK